MVIFNMWEVDNRIGLLLSYLSSLSILFMEYDIGVYLSYLSSLLAFKSLFINSPTYRLDIHWRSILLYLMNIILSAMGLFHTFDDRHHHHHYRSLYVSYSIVMIIISIITTCIYFIFPLPSKAVLTGPYKRIGTTTFNLVIHNRVIPVQVWFPFGSSSLDKPSSSSIIITYILSFISDNSKSLLWTSGHPSYQVQESLELMNTLASLNSLPSLFLKHLLLSRTNSIYCDNFQNIISQLNRQSNETCNVDIRRRTTTTTSSTFNKTNSNNNDNDVHTSNNNDRFPIAICSHGLYGWRQIHHSSCENLASHGYMVFSCDHNPDSTLTRPIGGDDDDSVVSSYKSFDFFCIEKQFTIEERNFYRNGMNRRVSDLRCIIDYIIKSDEFYQMYPELKNRLNHQIINLFGHSYGGGAITSLCCRKCDDNYDDSMNMANTLGEDCVPRDDGNVTHPNDNHFPSTQLLLSTSSSASQSYQIKAVALDGWMYPLCEQDVLNGLQPNTTLLNLSADLWPYGKVCLQQ